MTQTEALKLTLEFVESINLGSRSASVEQQRQVITAIKEALAHPEQRTWVGLTDVEIEQAIELISMLHGDYATEIAYAIETKLKELNT